MSPIIYLLAGGVGLVALAAAIVFRRRDPAFEREVADVERKQRVRAEAATRRDLRNFVGTLFIGAVAALVVWGVLGFPTSAADAMLAIRQAVTPAK